MHAPQLANPPRADRLYPVPSRFEPVKEVAWAELSPHCPFHLRREKPTMAQKLGIRYEKRAHQHFSELFPGRYGAGQWIAFRERRSGRVRYAQPDGVLVDYRRGQLTIFEMKLRHTDRAWWALRYVYEPLFSFLFPSWRLASCEIVRWFDPAVPWPESFRRTPSPSLLQAGEIGVHIWSP